MKPARRVYFIKPIGMDGPIKIGVSVAPERRREALEVWSPFKLEIVAEIDGDMMLELRFHALFAASQSHHEWFNVTPELLAVIAAINDGTFDLAALPPGRRLPRKPKDLSYITPEWRVQHGRSIRLGYEYRARRAQAAA